MNEIGKAYQYGNLIHTSRTYVCAFGPAGFAEKEEGQRGAWVGEVSRRVRVLVRVSDNVPR